MKHSWNRLALLLASDAVLAQRVIEGSVQHFQSQQTGPWVPLLKMGFGTPPQEITGIFDTGSSDTIVPLAGSPLCQIKNQQCTAAAPIECGQFDPTKAPDTAALAGERFNASFSGGDNFLGEYINTTVSLGTQNQVPETQVALASTGKPNGDFPQFPIFGTGPKAAEQTVDRNQIYDNLPQRMKDTGAIKGNSFSVLLDANPLGNGSVFFGGIDKTKFTGELQQVPITPDDGGILSDFVVNMTSVRLLMNGGQTTSVKTQKQSKHQGMKRSLWGRAAMLRRQRTGKGRYSNTGHAHQSTNGWTGKYNGHHHGAGDGGAINGAGNGNTNGNVNGGGNAGGAAGGGCNSNGNDGALAPLPAPVPTTAPTAPVQSAAPVAPTGNMINLGLRPDETFTLFDTGGVIVTLPQGVVSKMAKTLGASFSLQDGMGPVDCRLVNSANKLVMGFNDDKTMVTVPLENLRVSADLVDPRMTAEGLCALGIDYLDPGNNLNSIGFPFFSAVYTVFDLETNSLWFAQGADKANATTPQLQEFP